MKTEHEIKLCLNSSDAQIKMDIIEGGLLDKMVAALKHSDASLLVNFDRTANNVTNIWGDYATVSMLSYKPIPADV